MFLHNSIFVYRSGITKGELQITEVCAFGLGQTCEPHRISIFG